MMKRTNGLTSLKRLRFLANLRAIDVARELGLSPSAYSLVESGHMPISDENAAKLAKILRVPVAELFGEGGR
ncbi:MAG: helix-turn-helix transcriptional regulator [Thermodesulfobacteriota bacterium]